MENKTPNLNGFKMPKNIRQIGNIGENNKTIYIEDYVMSYINQLAWQEQNECKIAILLGHYVRTDEGKNIFIKGAILMEEANFNEGDIFTDEAWTNVYENIKAYFTDVEIVGWALMGMGFFLESTEKIETLHIDNFPGSDKVFLKIDSMEKEENFYLFENNKPVKQNGYYIYYEKNEEMQNYMIDHKEEGRIKEEEEDITTRKIRNVIQDKKEGKGDKGISRIVYAGGTLMAVIVLMVASTMLRNYHQMKNLETALNSLSQNLGINGQDEDSEDVLSNNTGSGDEKESDSNKKEGPSEPDSETDPTDSDDTVDVKRVPGNVKEVEEETEPPTEPETEPETEAPTEPATEAPTESQTKKDAPASNEVNYYIVRSGDSLASICKELYNTESLDKIQEIINLNGIENQDKIFAGQKLIVP